jgi:hypothetical protein
MRATRAIGFAAAGAIAILAIFGCASMWPASYHVDAHVPSTSDTVVWGYLPAGRAPVLTIRSGQTVRIDTVSH